MARDGRPALVVDAAIAEHLEVLCLARLGSVGVVERVGHADAVQRHLLDAVHERRLGEAGYVEDGRRDVDDVMELAADLAARLEPVRVVHDDAVASPPEVRRHLLGPLIRRVHRMRPADGIVVVGRR